MFLSIAQSNSATALMKLAGIICTGVLGGACFTTGIILRIEILTIVGICVLVLCIIALLLYYIFTRPLQQQQHPTLSTATAVANLYSTNNMNTMKRNKSDTDLELINRETAKNTIEDEQV
jgi:branched-subunit amino acid ABC-type transport system permease component